MVRTAEFYGIDPFDPRAAIDASRAHFGDVPRALPHVAGDPYAFALAAYNAGPGTVTYYGGRSAICRKRIAYIADIHERWSRFSPNADMRAAARSIAPRHVSAAARPFEAFLWV